MHSDKLDNREYLMALLAYVFFAIPMITKDVERSEFVRYHVNQAAVLFMATSTFAVVYLMVAVILHYSGALEWASWTVSSYTFRFKTIDSYALSFDWISWALTLTWIFPIALWGIGAKNVREGNMKPLPLIGKYTLIR